MNYYAGIGSRDTPADIMEIMTNIASVLENHNYILRSSGAKGADSAFEVGVQIETNKEIYLPWKEFNNSTSELYLDNIKESKYTTAYLMAEKFYHSNLSKASSNTIKYMTRNSFQIMGLDFMEPSEFVVCWTKDGKASGGTGQAIRIAEFYQIPVFNLKNVIDRELLSYKISEIKNEAC